MKNIKIIAVILAAFAFTFQSCTTEDPDMEPPVIAVQSPADHEQFHPGDVITFEATFTDNIALSQFKIDVHYGGDHDHKSVNHDDDEIEWYFEYIGDLTGTSQQVIMDITIPHNAKHGEYHFLVFCTDEAGNESLVDLDIEIEDEVH
jgi:hypothetical protein